MADAERVDNAVDALVERIVENGLGGLVGGLGLPGTFGTGGMPNQSGGSLGVGGLSTLAVHSRGWLISNQRTLLSSMYAEHGLVETVVDTPVHDALRAGFEISTGQLAPDEITELHSEMEEDGTNQLIGQGMKWTRLYGGGGLLVVTDQRPDTPLDWQALAEDRPLELIPFDLWELYREGRTDTDPGDKLDTEKTRYPINADFYDYYGRKVHKSRLIMMRGKEAPSFIRPRLQGWGLSVVETLIGSINQFLKSRALVFEVLDEFKLDIYKIQGFTNAMMTRDGTAKIQERVMLANTLKNFLNALLLDKNDEHESKQLSFAGIAEVQREIRIQCASDLRMPMTKIFGLSAAGFNSGEDDIEVYNGMVESDVRAPMRKLIMAVLALKCQRKFGFVPDDLRIKYKPLRILSAKDEEQIKDSKAARITGAVDKGIMSGKRAVEAYNVDNILGVQLDPDEDLSTARDREPTEPGDEPGRLNVPGEDDDADSQESET